MNRTMLCAALGAAAMMAATTAARAEDGQMRVDLAGLNLDSVAGAQTALVRIQTGASTFCDGDVGRQTLEQRAAAKQCAAQMTQNGVKTLNAPIVTALAEGRPVTEAPVAMAQK